MTAACQREAAGRAAAEAFKANPLLAGVESYDEDGLPVIVQAGHPALRGAAAAVDERWFGTPELEELADLMIKVMRAAPGVGLAAPQIGVPMQVIVLEDRPELFAHVPEERLVELGRREFETMAIVNPLLSSVGDRGMRYWEGCLSVQGFQACVERYLEVDVQGRRPDGSALSHRADGWQARILQHEVDHVRGTLYVDRMIPRSFMNGRWAQAPPSDVGDVPAACSCRHEIDRQK